ncbi:xanthine dehydrogenase family protein subunit M [Fodinicurvata sp. EGI_FJ10296]|uniref:FAD binding domain-containing protein n=1 Tax=Fodinicurvata sp. EGI_FJ10296 TaxID=3231908 RepID=UPI00345288D6
MYAFSYHRPTSLDDAAKALAGKPEAKFLAGGMTILPTMKQRLASPSDLIDLGAINELVGICEDNGSVVIGAMTTHAAVAADQTVARLIPAITTVASGIGDAQVRNRGTIGGSLANNDPTADYPAALLGLKGSVKTNKRTIQADDFFNAIFETALEEDEIIVSVTFPKPDAAAYVKFANPASRYAIVGVMVARTGGETRVAVTGAGQNGVFRATPLEQALSGSFDPAAVEGVPIATEELNSDIHASAEYRASLIKTLTKRAVKACL